MRHEENSIAKTLAELHDIIDVILRSALKRSIEETLEIVYSGFTLDSRRTHVVDLD